MSAQAQAPLLATKLHPPDPRDRLGRRPLLDRLTGVSCCVPPALAAHKNLKLVTHAKVEWLETDASGRTVTRVHVDRRGVA